MGVGTNFHCSTAYVVVSVLLVRLNDDQSVTQSGLVDSEFNRDPTLAGLYINNILRQVGRQQLLTRRSGGIDGFHYSAGGWAWT